MANAALQNTGRSVVAERQEAMANGEYKPRAKVTSHLNYGDETTDERRARLDAEAGTLKISRMFLR